MKLEVEICFLKHETRRSMKEKILIFFPEKLQNTEMG